MANISLGEFKTCNKTIIGGQFWLSFSNDPDLEDPRVFMRAYVNDITIPITCEIDIHNNSITCLDLEEYTILNSDEILDSVKQLLASKR